jgi:hypothetical protein
MSIKKILTIVVFFFFPIVTKSYNPLENKVKVTFQWTNKKFDLNMVLHEVPIEKALDARETIKQKLSDPAPSWLGRPISNSMILNKGQIKPFAMVIENPSDKSVYFFANPHVIEPQDNSFGFELYCLCVGTIHHIPPKSRWIRVGSVNVFKQVLVNKVVIDHALIGISEEKIKARKIEHMIN